MGKVTQQKLINNTLNEVQIPHPIDAISSSGPYSPNYMILAGCCAVQ